MAQCSFRQYLDKLPKETSQIWDELHRYHAAERTKMNVPMLEHQPLDMPFVFKEVAKHGGYAAVTVNRCVEKEKNGVFCSRPRECCLPSLSGQWPSSIRLKL